ncbi:hypothetical protein X777_15587, partial [Ooceraea biroi]
WSVVSACSKKKRARHEYADNIPEERENVVSGAMGGSRVKENYRRPRDEDSNGIKIVIELFIMDRDSLLPMPLDCTLSNALSYCLRRRTQPELSKAKKCNVRFLFRAFFEATR